MNDAPGLITVITKKEIEGFAAVNLGEVLNRVVGAAFLSPDVFMNQSIALRGQELTPYNNHVLFLLNGRPLRDPISGGMNSPVLSMTPLATIEQIEVIRGPGSVLYGSCAYSGVINIITKKQAEDGWSGSATPMTYGTNNFMNSNATINYKKGELGVDIGMNYLKDDGFEYSFYDYKKLYATDKFHKEGKAATVGINYKGFRLNTYLSDFNPYSLDGSELWASGYLNRHQSLMLDLGYEKQINDKIKINANFTNNRHNWNGASGKITVIDTTVVPQFTQLTDSKTKGLSYLGEFSTRYTPIENLNILAGLGYEYTTWEGARLHSGNQNAFFGYLQTDYKLHRLAKLIGGVQYNKIENIPSNLSFRAGVISNFTEKLGMKLLYSEAFRRGYPLETSFAVSVFRGNPLLEPEKIKTAEVQLFYSTKKFHTSIAYYHSTMFNLITRKRYTIDPAPVSGPPFYLQYLNEGEATFQGLEYEAKYNIINSLLATAALSFQTSERNDVKDALLHPNTMIKVGLLYTKTNYSIGIFNNYVSAGKSTTLINPTSAQINKPADAYNLLSAKASYKISLDATGKYKVMIFGQADNILNKEINYVDFPNKSLNTLVPLYGGRTYNGGVTFIF